MKEKVDMYLNRGHFFHFSSVIHLINFQLNIILVAATHLFCTQTIFVLSARLKIVVCYVSQPTDSNFFGLEAKIRYSKSKNMAHFRPRIECFDHFMKTIEK